ncbi:MAG: hypothetical protein H0V49_00100 [Nocardioidaceae bacterium]|nr:hypothetical protein [Nocardioidaceae bacterium]
MRLSVAVRVTFVHVHDYLTAVSDFGVTFVHVPDSARVVGRARGARLDGPPFNLAIHSF